MSRDRALKIVRAIRAYHAAVADAWDNQFWVDYTRAMADLGLQPEPHPTGLLSMAAEELELAFPPTDAT